MRDLTTELDRSSLTEEEKNLVYRQVMVFHEENISPELPKDYNECKEFLYEIWTCDHWENDKTHVYLDSFNAVDLDSLDSSIVLLDCGHDGFDGDDVDCDIGDPAHPKYLQKFKRFTELKRLFVCGYYCPYTDEELLSVLPKGVMICKRY